MMMHGLTNPKLAYSSDVT